MQLSNGNANGTIKLEDILGFFLDAGRTVKAALQLADIIYNSLENGHAVD